MVQLLREKHANEEERKTIEMNVSGDVKSEHLI